MRPPPAKGVLAQLELRCPPFPQTLLDAVDMLEHLDDIEVRPVARMVERDPILLAQLLKTVNSAYYGLQQTITSPERAVVLLGPVTVVGLVAGMSMLRLRPIVTDVNAAIVDRVIAHSLATAYLTRFLIEEIPGHVTVRQYPSLARNGGAFTAGLLHDLGKFILLYNHPDEAASLYRDRVLDDLVAPRDACEHERLLFGCDHTEAGVVAAQHSHFPEALTNVIRLHHTPSALRGEGVAPETAALLRAAVGASHAASWLGYGISERDADAHLNDPVWAELLRRDHPGLGSIDALVDQVAAQAEPLHQYVGALTTSYPNALDRLRKQMRLVR